jgi:heme/copper-type cytochrome/quinol oxidase subunit 2
MKKFLTGLFAWLIVNVSHATPSAGSVAANTNEVLETITGIITVILYVAAMGVFVSACMKYRLHRQNPQQIPLSTPITELVLAIVLAGLPTVSKMTNEHLFQTESKLIQSQQTPSGPRGIAPRPAPRY